MTSSCLHLHRPTLFDCFENFAIRKRECYFCFASISANRQVLINKPTKQILALVRKEYGRKKERDVEGYYASRVIIPSRELLEYIKVFYFNAK